LLTFSGTWAPPGVGYPSDVAQACLDVADEIPVQAPWSFGPIPPGEFRSPSYQESVTIGRDWAVDWVLGNPDRPFMLGGYSQGGECASLVYAETLPGGRLESLRPNYVGGFTFGNPSRHLEHTFYGGPPTDGEGIAQYRQPPMGDEWCDLVDTLDMYGGVPATLTGEIMRDVYTLCTEMEMHSGAAAFAQTLVANCIEVLGNLDGDAYDDVKSGAARQGVDLSEAQTLPPARINLLGEKVTVKGLAAVLQACVLGLQFLCTSPPTAAHIQYEIREVFPGQTYVQLAIQHVHYWAGVPR
jgi:hypothetical protein